MDIIINICKSVTRPLNIINKITMKGRLTASILVVLITALIGSILTSTGSLPILFLAGVLTWIAACTLFWLLSLLFKKQVDFVHIVSTWGFSYVPNLLCIIAYALIQLQFGFFTNSIFGFLMNTFFIMLLIWKAIYFFIEMKYVIGTTGFELFVITIISSIAFALLMWVGFSLGIQVPML